MFVLTIKQLPYCALGAQMETLDVRSDDEAAEALMLNMMLLSVLSLFHTSYA